MSHGILNMEPELAAVPEKETAPAAPRDMAPPSFAPFFDVNTPLPGERNPKFGGYITGLDEKLYRPWPGINSSTLKERTPCQMLHALTEKRERTWNSVTLGTVVHWAVLEPSKFDAKERDKHMLLCETEGLDTKTANAQRRDNPGKLLVTARLMDTAHRCIEAVQWEPKAAAILSDPTRTNEASAFVWDEQFGIWRKARFDILSPGRDYLADVKTTSAEIDERSWEKECYKFGYFLQAAWYLHTHWLLTGERRKFFRWIVVTNEAPFMCRTFYMLNRQASDPLYEQSKLCWARQVLGLDESIRIGRLSMFINSARETEDLRARGVPLTPGLLRQTWPAYEQESPEMEVL